MFVFEHEGIVKSCAVDPTTLEPYRDVIAYEVAPPADKEFRDAWVINAGQLDYDMVKAKEIKTKETNALCEEALKVITDQYSEAEMKTWDIQEAEARSADPEPPFLVGLSAASGKSVADLKAKIIQNADAFKTISAQQIGRRQAMEAAIEAATTIEELKAVTF